MTAIIGLRRKGRVYIGGDSAFSNSYTITLLSDQKVFRNGNTIFGCTGELRMMVLLRYALKIPPYTPGRDLLEYMVLDFTDAVRHCFKEGGFAEKKDERETGGTFIIGIEERLFYMQDEYQVGEPADAYYCIGSGEEATSGAMHLACSTDLPPEVCLEKALQAAEYHTKSVRGPFTIISSINCQETL